MSLFPILAFLSFSQPAFADVAPESEPTEPAQPAGEPSGEEEEEEADDDKEEEESGCSSSSKSMNFGALMLPLVFLGLAAAIRRKQQ